MSLQRKDSKSNMTLFEDNPKVHLVQPSAPSASSPSLSGGVIGHKAIQKAVATTPVLSTHEGREMQKRSACLE